MTSKRVLVTGATGFVGSNLARYLLALGHEVHLLVRPGYQTWRIQELSDDLAIHVASLTDESGVSRVVGEVRPEWVFHLAAHGAYSWQQDIGAMIATNLLGTVHVLNACLATGFESFVHTGSSSEYGFKDHAPHEREWLEPNSYYAVTKASATMFCRYTAQKYGAWIPTLRLYSVYGPFEEPNRLVPNLILYGLDNTYPPLVAPETARDFVYVDDVCEAYLRLAAGSDDEPGPVYNLGTGWQTTLRQAVDVAREELNLTTEPSFGSMEGRSWDSSVWVANSDRIARALNWHPRYTFTEGFRRTVAWFREHPEWLAFYRKEGERK